MNEEQPIKNLPGDNEDKRIVKVEAKPVEIQKKETKAGLTKISNLRIDKIGSLTLNIIAKPLKNRYNTHYKKEKLYLVIDIILAVIVLVLLGSLINLWLFSKNSQVHLMDFKVTANPTNLINGQASEFTIDYANKTNSDLSDVILVLKIPDSLKNPQYNLPDFNLKTNTLNIGNLPGHAHGQLNIKGFLLGNYNDNHEFIAAITYKNKYGQSRQEFFNQSFTLTDSVVKAQIILPPKIIASGKFTAKINLKNTSSLDFTNLKIKMLWPDNFSFLNSDLGSPLSADLWQIEQFKAKSETSYNFTGRLFGQKPQEEKFEAEIYATSDHTEYLLTKVQNSAPLAFSKLELTFLNQENNRYISPGGETTYTLHYKNNETYALTNVEISLDLSGEYAGSLNPLNFNQNTNPQLAKMDPGAEGSFEVRAKAKSIINFTIYKENGFQLEARISADYDDLMQNNRINIESAPIFTQVNSQLILKTLGLFYTQQGDQIGVGSIPPKVGEYTSYWAIIQINNTTNKIKDLKVIAKLPAGVDFTNIYNVTDGDQIFYNDTTRTLEWSVDSISALAGYFNPAPEARIQLAITPTTNQVGQSPALLTNITATATDTISNAFLSATGKNISTAIFTDQSQNKVTQ
ncbi:MAG: hypothetical protein WC460_02355 [Patescibacteria group bacterium]